MEKATKYETPHCIKTNFSVLGIVHLMSGAYNIAPQRLADENKLKLQI